MADEGVAQAGEDEASANRMVDLVGRQVEVRPPGALQLSMVMRHLNRAQRLVNDGQATPAMLLEAVAKALTLFESMIVKEDDQEHAVEMVITRQLDVDGLLTILSVFTTEDNPATTANKRRTRVRRA